MRKGRGFSGVLITLSSRGKRAVEWVKSRDGSYTFEILKEFPKLNLRLMEKCGALYYRDNKWRAR